jgi:Flp pilus assembly protein TadG
VYFRLTAYRPSWLDSLPRLGDVSGAAAVEFALVAPVYLLLILGGLVFSLMFSNYLSVSNAAYAGASQLILSRSLSTPYTSTVSVVDAAAGNLTTSSLTIAVAVNGTACSSDSACQSALSNAASQQASVTVTYTFSPPSILQYNFFPSQFALSSSVVGMVQ